MVSRKRKMKAIHKGIELDTKRTEKRTQTVKA
ncbi:hypothetical protein JOD18_000394 [Gracilibacillus alcaliphilus]|nr:hypothetical protein [Gracilibacillus alcaliphilus]